MVDSSILLDDQAMERFAQGVAEELPIFRIYSTPEAFAERWIGGVHPDGCAELGVYVVLLFRRKFRLFHVGENDDGTFGWIREINDPVEMGGTVIGKIDNLDASMIARTIMAHFHADPESGTELVQEERPIPPDQAPVP